MKDKDKNKKCLCDKSYGDLCGCEKIAAKRGEAVTKPLLDLKIAAASGAVESRLLTKSQVEELIKKNKIGKN